MTLLAWEMSAIVQWLAYALVLPFLEIGMRPVVTARSSRFVDIVKGKP